MRQFASSTWTESVTLSRTSEIVPPRAIATAMPAAGRAVSALGVGSGVAMEVLEYLPWLGDDAMRTQAASMRASRPQTVVENTH